MGEWEAWIKAGTGDEKTNIVVIADFWERTGGMFSRDRDISSNAFFFLGEDSILAAPGTRQRWTAPTTTEDVFRSRRSPATRREHAASALGTKCGDFAIL